MTSSDSDPPAEAGQSTATRGQSLWGRLRSLLRQGSLRDDLEVLLEDENSAEASDFSDAERTLLQNVLKLGDKRVDDVMVPRADIVAIEANENLGTLLGRFLEAGHSRIPVYDDDLDDITGFVH